MSSLYEGVVLVVEDEGDSMELVQGVLEYHGIQSAGAQTAEDALEQLKHFIPNVILIDLALPQMDGWSLLKELRRHPELDTIPRIALTAFHHPSLVNQALEAGFDAYFPKPIDATTFVRELEGLVG